jgi:hypothetical protein|tara:strand:+ start:5875 stop:6096 length:222 start_codon:yes stop_codon:yes gene_type:complete
MNENERILELYINEQHEKINDLSRQVLLLATKNKFLTEKLENVESGLKTIENINKKKTNSVSGFNHSITINKG